MGSDLLLQDLILHVLKDDAVTLLSIDSGGRQIAAWQTWQIVASQQTHKEAC